MASQPEPSQHPNPCDRALEFLPIGQIQPRGWLQEQLEQDLDGFVGQFPTICAEASSDIFVHGRVAGGDRRHWWDGETEGKWLDGFTRLAHVLNDPQATAAAADRLQRLIEHQDADGYLGIYDHSWRTGGHPCPGDLWTQTFVLLALLSQYEASGEDSFLNAARRATDATISRHGPHGHDHPFVGSAEDSMVLAHNLLIVEPVLWLYQITADQELLDFARFCYEAYSHAELGWPESDGQLARISDSDLPFIGHGAHTCAQLRVPLLLYFATGDPRYRDAYQVGFAKIIECLGISGACKSDESIGTRDEASAPLPSAGYEYCAITELLHSWHLALVCTGDLSYADHAERLALNAAQASRQQDGLAIGYFGADNQYVASKTAGNRWDYSPTHDDQAVCCNPSAARVFAHHISRAVLRTPDDGLLIAFYGPLHVNTTVRDVEVAITCSTSYPFEDIVRIKVRAIKPVKFPLRLRVPSWRTTMTVTTDARTAHRDGAIYLIDTEWSARTVRVDFGASIKAVSAVDQTKAIERGPLIYALEIPARSQHTRDYPLAGYHDTDYTPEPDAVWDYTLLVDAKDPGRLCRARLTTSANNGFPWAESPVQINAGVLEPATRTNSYYTAMEQDLTFVPIGATTLRRTCFAHVPRKSSAQPHSGFYTMRESTP